jgi:uncharacterized protein (TIGR03083 family)
MSPSRWDPASYTRAVGGEIGRMAGAVRGADPAAAVPSCPDWTISQLVRHTGTVHRWAAQMVRDRASERLDPRTVDLALPDDPRSYPDWLAAGLEPLVAAFAAADPDEAMWAWGADQHVRFWPRRMLHETVVHRVDAELAISVSAVLDAATAADGIDELLENLPCAAPFRPRVAELRGAGESIALRSTDGDDRWLIRLAPDGFRWERSTGDATITVTATTDSLLLLLYGRRALGDVRLDITGDTRVLTRWLESSAL